MKRRRACPTAIRTLNVSANRVLLDRHQLWGKNSYLRLQRSIVCILETSVRMYQTARDHITEDNQVHTYHRTKFSYLLTYSTEQSPS